MHNLVVKCNNINALINCAKITLKQIYSKLLICLQWISHRVQTVTITATIGIGTAETTGTEATTTTVDVQRNVTTAGTVVAGRGPTAGSGTLAVTTGEALREICTGI